MTTGRHLVHARHRRRVRRARSPSTPTTCPSATRRRGRSPSARSSTRASATTIHRHGHASRSTRVPRLAAGGTYEGLFYRADRAGRRAHGRRRRSRRRSSARSRRSSRSTRSTRRSRWRRDTELRPRRSASSPTDVMRGLEIADRIPTGIVHINDQTVSDEVDQPVRRRQGAPVRGARFGGPQANIEAFTADAVGDHARRPARIPVLSSGARQRPSRDRMTDSSARRSASSAPARPACCCRTCCTAPGIESVVLEARSREYVEQRVRAGVLEQGTRRSARRARPGRPAAPRGPGPPGHRAAVRRAAASHRADRPDRPRASRSTASRSWSRTSSRPGWPRGGRSHFEVEDVALAGIDPGGAARSASAADGDRRTSCGCDFVAGCDGFHGVSPRRHPGRRAHDVPRDYPFAWLGILAAVAPSTDELIYAHHERGFALHSLRSPDDQPALPPGATRRAPSTAGRTSGSGRSCARGSRSDDGWDAAPTARCSRRASRRCAASWSSRCSTAGCSWPATRRTSCRRPAPRG